MEMTLPSYDLRRLDGDPTYAPGRVIIDGTPWWRAPAADAKAGFLPKSFRLSGLSEEEAADKCRSLVRELLAWRRGAPRVQPYTWAWAIARYLGDELSPYQDAKANTRRSYREVLDGWLKSETVADTRIDETTFEVLKRWKKAMETNGRSTSLIQRRFTHLRMVANYGLAIKPTLFRDVCAVLSSGALKIRSPRPRDVAPTAAQIEAIIASADAAGDAMFALGLSLQWWLTLRPVDVRGQWLDDKAGRRWADGLTWDMVDLAAGTITKMPSKTERHDDRPMVWDIAQVPGLVARFDAIPADKRIGPVITNKAGIPYDTKGYRKLWTKHREAAGVPAQVKLMDTRAGAITHAKNLGADKISLQHAANHMSGDTTERYIRARDEGANKVIRLRTASNIRDAG